MSVQQAMWLKWRSRFISIMKERDPHSCLPEKLIHEMAEEYRRGDFWSWRDISPEDAVSEQISYINEFQ